MSHEIGPLLIEMLPRLRRFAISLSRSHDIADDLVQSACERALAARRSLTADMSFDAWMFRILRNLWIDRLRRKRTRGEEMELSERRDIPDPFAGTNAERHILLSQVAVAIDALPDDQRELLLLVCVEEVSYRDAADILGLPIGTVMSRLARARRHLAETTGLAKSDL